MVLFALGLPAPEQEILRMQRERSREEEDQNGNHCVVRVDEQG